MWSLLYWLLVASVHDNAIKSVYYIHKVTVSKLCSKGASYLGKSLEQWDICKEHMFMFGLANKLILTLLANLAAGLLLI